MSKLPELSIHDAAIAYCSAVDKSTSHRKAKPGPHMIMKMSEPHFHGHPRMYETECDARTIAYQRTGVWDPDTCTDCVRAYAALAQWVQEQRWASQDVTRAQKILLRAIAREAPQESTYARNVT